ncbi:LysR family transcriptional regulator ArgP [Actinospica sp. MGRD01-02]|uniref:HTH-type transcriptional regulator LysG n=1 Tax=Actinospica acidithermotolerans TaxID=2828514 RepID=A0A941EH14_9ACTN|nr:LysR family transcriptional regulator ArgP [Actinospica acidithermotolerans]MBR7828924.1 LysR family transcriptional regulator ArgP [Actinospica acidithermotolerans]
MMQELPLDQVRTLLAAVDEGTFDAAAAALHVTPSAVSQRVKALEQRIGRVLLTRTKPIALTDSGEVLVRYARQLVRLEADAAAELGLDAEQQAPTTIAVAVNADSLSTWFLDALTRIPASLRVGFELLREDEAHTAALLRRGRVAAAVTRDATAVTGCRVTKLGVMRYRASASPAFVERWLSTGPVERTLPAAPVLVFDRNDELQDRFLSTLAGRPPSREQIRHLIPTSEAFLGAVARGIGWGMIPDEQAALLPEGALVEVAPGHSVDVPLYWQQWKLDSPALKALSDAVVSAAQVIGRKLAQ